MSRTTLAVLALAAGLGMASAAAVEATGPRRPDPYWSSSGAWGQAYPDQWGLARTGWRPELAAEAGTAVIVAVIDTGLDYYHPDMRPENIYFNPGEVLNGRDDDANGYVDDVLGWNFVDGNGNPWDQAGHGTHVAGTIAAALANGEGIAGMVPAARILPLKALNFIGRGRASRVAEAVHYAVGQGARVINLSLGGEQLSRAARRAVEYAQSKGVVVVVAAGNDAQDIGGGGLAAMDGVITVGASGPDDRRASFSNYGARVDLVAPGVDILSLRARRTDLALMAETVDYTPGRNFVGPRARYYRASGTSFAAPFVSGVAAMIRGRRPELDAAAVKRMIVHSARDIGTPGVDQETGYGLLDARAALAADPGFFVMPAIRGIEVVQKPDGMYVRMTGTADADQFRAAWVEYAEGDSPTAWQRTPDTLKVAVRDATLADLSATLFHASSVWTLRLVVEHENGTQREARHVLRLE